MFLKMLMLSRGALLLCVLLRLGNTGEIYYVCRGHRQWPVVQLDGRVKIKGTTTDNLYSEDGHTAVTALMSQSCIFPEACGTSCHWSKSSSRRLA